MSSAGAAGAASSAYDAATPPAAAAVSNAYSAVTTTASDSANAYTTVSESTSPTPHTTDGAPSNNSYYSMANATPSVKQSNYDAIVVSKTGDAVAFSATSSDASASKAKAAPAMPVDPALAAANKAALQRLFSEQYEAFNWNVTFQERIDGVLQALRANQRYWSHAESRSILKCPYIYCTSPFMYRCVYLLASLTC